MAIKTNYIMESTGLTINDAYIKISLFRGTKTSVSMDVEVYVSEAARFDGKSQVQGLTYTIPTPTTDILPALYTYLKTLPEFANAVDC